MDLSPSAILDAARQRLFGSKNAAYGLPENNFAYIAELWSSYLQKQIQAKDVALMMVLLKIARERSVHNPDSYVDMCGYAAIAAGLNHLPGGDL